MKGIILTGGTESRLYPMTKAVAKLLSIGESLKMTDYGQYLISLIKGGASA